jgi:hypothetical protein
MGKLTDILQQGGYNAETFAEAWRSTKPAEDFAPLPAGGYVATLERAELTNARTKQTPGVKLTFKVLEGPHAGRLVWADLWLSERAREHTKRDLLKLGVTDLSQLEQPVPEGIVCRLVVVLRRGDDGRSWNDVKTFDVLRIETPEADPFAAPEEGGRDAD